MPTRPRPAARARVWCAAFAAILAQCGRPAADAFADQVHDLGVVRHGSKPRHTFILCERAPRAFVIQGSETTCACASNRVLLTRAGEERREVPKFPLAVATGDRIEIEMTVDTSLKDAVDAGPLEFGTRVNTDMPDHAIIVVACTARIRCPLVIRPGGVVDLGAVSRRQTAITHLDLRTRDGKPLRVLGIDGDTTGITVKPLGTLGDGTVRYEICSPPGRDCMDGRLVRPLRVRTDADGGYDFDVVVRMFELSPFTVVPDARMSFGRVAVDQPGAAEVTVKENAPTARLDFAVDRIELTIDGAPAEASPLFKAELTPLPAVHAVKVRLNYVGGFQGKSFQGTLRLRTQDPDQKELAIPFLGFARD